MMNPVPWLQMTNMISYQGLVRTFLSIPVTNTSVNPARSTAVAIFQGGWALEQLWFFWVVPIVGGIIGGLIYRTLLEKRD